MSSHAVVETDTDGVIRRWNDARSRCSVTLLTSQ